MNAKSYDPGAVALAQLRERFPSGTEAQLDPVGDPGFGPVAACDRRPFLVHVAADEAAVGRQNERDRQRAVTGERADLDRPARADEPREKREEHALVGADLHAGFGKLRGLLAQPLLHRGLMDDDGAEVAVDGFGEQRTMGHDGRSMVIE